LGQRCAIAIGDLAARGGNVEDVGAGLLLCFPSGLDRFLKGRRDRLLRQSRQGPNEKKQNQPRITPMVADVGQVNQIFGSVLSA
jgi:hypothetical protein